MKLLLWKCLFLFQVTLCLSVTGMQWPSANLARLKRQHAKLTQDNVASSTETGNDSFLENLKAATADTSALNTATNSTTTGKDSLTTTTSTTTTTEEPNPCNRNDPPPAPDFRARGRRISEVKCYEYVYDIKRREELNTKRVHCRKYLLEHGAFFTTVAGGRNVTPGEFPHMGAIGWEALNGTWIFKCGGTLISNKFVLTAAHCTKASERDTTVADVVPKIVRFGDRNIIDRTDYDSEIEPVEAEILNIIEYPQYLPPRKYFDIALIELKSEVKFSRLVQPACLYAGPDDILIGKNATVTGWGVVDTAGRKTSPILQAGVVDVIESQLCDSLLRASCNRLWCGIQQHQICAGKLSGGVDACQGDSGGPLQVKITLPFRLKGVMYYVVGVTSFGIKCAQKNLPGIYTRVSSFLDWIENIVWKN